MNPVTEQWALSILDLKVKPRRLSLAEARAVVRSLRAAEPPYTHDEMTVWLAAYRRQDAFQIVFDDHRGCCSDLDDDTTEGGS